jgi:hypothetical protein
LRSLAIVVVVAAVLAGGMGMTGVAAQSSIPGDALYSVKTGIEQTRLSMAGDAGDRALLKMSFAEQRLGEISKLIAEGRFTEVKSSVLDFEADINNAILELSTVSAADPARAGSIALQITSALSRYASTLSDMAAVAPQSVKGEVDRALETTHLASSLDMSSGADSLNANEDVSNGNGSDDSLNANEDISNGNGSDDSLNANEDLSNGNGSDDSLNANEDLSNGNGTYPGYGTGADDNTNSTDVSNGNGADDNTNSVDISNGNGGVDDNSNTNVNTNTNSGSGGSNSNSNSNDSSGSGKGKGKDK